MDRLDWSLYRAGGPGTIRRTERARPGGKDPAHVLAGKAADALGVDLGDPKDNTAGLAVHYGIGWEWAPCMARYGACRRLSPQGAARCSGWRCS